MSGSLGEVIKQQKVYSCIDCGKCVSSCPLAKAGEEFSPRVIIEEALLGLDFFNHRDFWLCLTCQACIKKCPSNVRFPDFIEAARLIADGKGIKIHSLFCERCGKRFLTTPILEYIKKNSEESEPRDDFLVLCPTCRKHYMQEKWRPH